MFFLETASIRIWSLRLQEIFIFAPQMYRCFVSAHTNSWADSQETTPKQTQHRFRTDSSRITLVWVRSNQKWTCTYPNVDLLKRYFYINNHRSVWQACCSSIFLSIYLKGPKNWFHFWTHLFYFYTDKTRHGACGPFLFLSISFCFRNHEAEGVVFDQIAIVLSEDESENLWYPVGGTPLAMPVTRETERDVNYNRKASDSILGRRWTVHKHNHTSCDKPADISKVFTLLVEHSCMFSELLLEITWIRLNKRMGTLYINKRRPQSWIDLTGVYFPVVGGLAVAFPSLLLLLYSL